MALDREPEASSRRIVTRALLLLTPVVAGGVALPVLLRELRPGAPASPPRGEAPTAEEVTAARQAERKLAEAQRAWISSETLAPRQEQVDRSGEVTAPFSGFGVSVDSVPEGARVLVDGRDVGEAPVLASVACTPGAPVEVRVEKPPWRPRTRTTRCRGDTLVRISVRLSR